MLFFSNNLETKDLPKDPVPPVIKIDLFLQTKLFVTNMSKVTFDLEHNTITLVYKASSTGITKTITSPLNITNHLLWSSAFIEYHFNDDDIKGKWVFQWKQYNGKEQFFSLSQYLPWQMSPFPQPRHYEPWTTLAQWSYIAEPSKGTLQTNNIYFWN